jgi:hypothetical protein
VIHEDWYWYRVIVQQSISQAAQHLNSCRQRYSEREPSLATHYRMSQSTAQPNRPEVMPDTDCSCRQLRDLRVLNSCPARYFQLASELRAKRQTAKRTACVPANTVIHEKANSLPPHLNVPRSQATGRPLMQGMGDVNPAHQRHESERRHGITHLLCNPHW